MNTHVRRANQTIKRDQLAAIKLGLCTKQIQRILERLVEKEDDCVAARATFAQYRPAIRQYADRVECKLLDRLDIFSDGSGRSRAEQYLAELARSHMASTAQDPACALHGLVRGAFKQEFRFLYDIGLCLGELRPAVSDIGALIDRSKRGESLHLPSEEFDRLCIQAGIASTELFSALDGLMAAGQDVSHDFAKYVSDFRLWPFVEAALDKLEVVPLPLPKPVPPPDGMRANTMLLSAADVGDLLGCSERKIWQMHSAGRLPPSVSLGCSRRWKRKEIKDWVMAGCPERSKWTESRRRVSR